MRAAVLFALIAGVGSAQVQSAPDVGVSGPTILTDSAVALAQGSLAVVNFGPTASFTSSATVSLLPVNSTTQIAAQVTNVTSYAITFVVPPDVPAGAAQLIYKPGGQATQWTQVMIVPANLSLYRTGTLGPLLAQNINPDGTPVLNGLTTPVQPGQPVVLWGTGLGTTPQSAVQITLGGAAQTVLYAGAAPGQPGLNQINFSIAPGTPDGCYVPLTVMYGTQSLTSFLSKTSDGLPCHHPFGLSTAAMKLLDGGAPIDTGEVTVNSSIGAAAPDRASRQESASLLPLSLNASGIANFFTGASFDPAQPCSIAAGATGVAFLGGGFDQATLGTVTLQNSQSTLMLPWTSSPTSDSPLNSLPPAVIAGGGWTLNSSGSSGLPASSFAFALPPPIQIAGSAPLTLNRNENQTITWDGSGYDSYATVFVNLTAGYAGSPALTCAVPAQAGAVTLPASLLMQFSSGAAGSVSVLAGESGSGLPHAQFNFSYGAPLLMLMNWNSSDARPVDFQ